MPSELRVNQGTPRTRCPATPPAAESVLKEQPVSIATHPLTGPVQTWNGIAAHAGIPPKVPLSCLRADSGHLCSIMSGLALRRKTLPGHWHTFPTDIAGLQASCPFKEIFSGTQQLVRTWRATYCYQRTLLAHEVRVGCALALLDPYAALLVRVSTGQPRRFLTIPYESALPAATSS